MNVMMGTHQTSQTTTLCSLTDLVQAREKRESSATHRLRDFPCRGRKHGARRRNRPRTVGEWEWFTTGTCKQRASRHCCVSRLNTSLSHLLSTSKLQLTIRLYAQSRTVEIKQEPQTSYQLVAGADSTVDRKMDKPDLDEATQRAIKEAQNEYSTRRRPPKAAPSDLVPTASVVSPRASPPAPSPKSQPAPSKKRPAPKNSSTTSTAKAKAANAKKPPPKKLKLGPSDNGAPAIGTPSSQGARSATPTSASGRKASVSKQTSTTNAPRKASKSAASADPDGEASSDSDSGMIYCICRKPDNHTWMIGCDGPCEDWFHGKCVDLAREDEDLLDKYICPNCEAGGIGVTTWKPMCRRDGCRKPARLKKGGESKYCTDECGLAFMREALGRAGALNYKGGRNNMPQQRRKSSTAKAKPRSPREDEQQSEEDELDIGPLGGRLRAPELKSLVHSVPDAASFRRLGSPGILTPPATASPERDDPTIGDSPIATRRDDTSDNGDLTEQEAARLGEIAERKADLRRRRGIVQDRERVVNMVKERAGRSKDQCGFDERLAWDEERFEAWRNCTSGRAVFEKGTLDAEDEMHPHVKSEGEGAGANTPAAATTTTTTTTCKLTKKKCHRHGQWQKIVLQDVRFEKADVGDEMRRVDREERQIREEAGARGRVQGRSSRKGLSWESERDYGGSVEVVGE